MVIKIKKSAIMLCLLMFLTVAGSFSLKDTALSAAAQGADCIYIPALMYHHFLPNSAQLGKYVITPSEFENDIKYLTQAGYTAVSVKDIQNYVKKGTPLPKKPFMITVDDGYFSFYKYAYPVLLKYKCKAIFSPIAYFTEIYSENGESNPIYTHVTYDQIDEMLRSTLIEIANHSYNMHNLSHRYGVRRLKCESSEEYRAVFTVDTERAQQIFSEKNGYLPYIYTYPFGYHNKVTDEMIEKLGFSASFICEERVNRVSGRDFSTFNLCRYNRAHGINFEAFWGGITQKCE